MSTIELLPCPFCGGEPYLQKWENGFRPPDITWNVRCRGCGASPYRTAEDEEEAAEAWNRRASQSTNGERT